MAYDPSAQPLTQPAPADVRALRLKIDLAVWELYLIKSGIRETT